MLLNSDAKKPALYKLDDTLGEPEEEPDFSSYKIEGVDYDALKEALKDAHTVHSQKKSGPAVWNEVLTVDTPEVKHTHDDADEVSETVEDDFVLIDHMQVEMAIQASLEDALRSCRATETVQQHDVMLALQYAKLFSSARTSMNQNEFNKSLKALGNTKPTQKATQKPSGGLWSGMWSMWSSAQWLYWGFKLYRNNQTGRVVLTWAYKAATYALVLLM